MSMDVFRRVAIELKLRGATYKQIAALLKITPSYAVRLCAPSKQTKREIYIRATWREDPRGKLKCELCGRQVGRGQIHHLLTKGNTKRVYSRDVTKESVANFNRRENLIHLCIACHRTFHSIRFCSSDVAKECVERIRRAP